ncbi:hypothetical protein AVEN_12782-1 [Araneus ventricosus]|uniref:Uncharacterized protein n=1 Tax=Araneus ventricosus TaxID=182803 RepID=A0A4Y2ABF1_ARAVE|nr:hypothetical protein AVEN_12782-1 [Araneus ventricosus]
MRNFQLQWGRLVVGGNGFGAGGARGPEPFHQNSVVFGACFTLNHAGDQTLSLIGESLRGRDASSGVSSDRGSKLQGRGRTWKALTGKQYYRMMARYTGHCIYGQKRLWELCTTLLPDNAALCSSSTTTSQKARSQLDRRQTEARNSAVPMHKTSLWRQQRPLYYHLDAQDTF